MSATAAASGKGLVSGMMRQRVPSKEKAPPSSDLSPAHARHDGPVFSGKLHLLDVYMGGTEGTGRPFHTLTGDLPRLLAAAPEIRILIHQSNAFFRSSHDCSFKASGGVMYPACKRYSISLPLPIVPPCVCCSCDHLRHHWHLHSPHCDLRTVSISLTLHSALCTRPLPPRMCQVAVMLVLCISTGAACTRACHFA